MSYTQFAYAEPNTTQTRQDSIDSIRNNLLALRDAVALGYVPGWDMTPGDSSNTATATFTATMANPAEPQIIKYENGTEEILLWITWTSNAPSVIKYYYSPDNSSGYPANRELIGQENITYDGSQNVSGVTWT